MSNGQEIEVRVAPTQVYEYKLVELVHPPSNSELELNQLGAEGWVVSGVVLDGSHVLMARQTAVGLIPIEEPKILGASRKLTLARPGNGR